MNFLKSITIGAAMILGMTAYAQRNCDIDIAITDITKGDVVPKAVNNKLEAKLAQALSRAGIVAAPYDAQFFVAGRFDNAYSDVMTSGTRPTYAVKTTLTIYIGDADHQKVFATESFDLKGVGNTETEAYTRCLNSINASNPKFIEFIRKGKDKIMEYFDANYPVYLNNAKRALQQRNYDEALFYASSIPSCCKGYAEAQALTASINKDNTNFNSQQLYAQAQAAWAANPDEYGAEQAHKYLAQIDPASSSYAAAQNLSKQISTKIQRNWDFEHIQKHKDAVALEKQRIQANKEKYIAWAKSRPKVVNRYHFLVRYW